MQRNGYEWADFGKSGFVNNGAPTIRHNNKNNMHFCNSETISGTKDELKSI